MKKNVKVEVIPNHYKNTCWTCGGKGKVDKKKCKTCNGTGIFVDTHYIMVVGKYAFDMDSIK